MATHRPWYTHGTFGHEKFKLPDNYRKELVKVIGETQSRKDDFISAIETAIGYAKGAKTHRDTILPASIRNNLKTALKEVKQLQKTLNDLDQFSIHLLSETNDTFSKGETLDKIASYRDNIEAAIKEAEKLPRRGKLYQGHCRLLSYLVAVAINDVIGITPTLSHNEPSATGVDRTDKFAQTLEIALKAASFQKHKKTSSVNLYYLMKEGIRTLKQREIDGGLTMLREGSF